MFYPSPQSITYCVDTLVVPVTCFPIFFLYHEEWILCIGSGKHQFPMFKAMTRFVNSCRFNTGGLL